MHCTLSVTLKFRMFCRRKNTSATVMAAEASERWTSPPLLTTPTRARADEDGSKNNRSRWS